MKRIDKILNKFDGVWEKILKEDLQDLREGTSAIPKTLHGETLSIGDCYRVKDRIVKFLRDINKENL